MARVDERGAVILDPDGGDERLGRSISKIDHGGTCWVRAKVGGSYRPLLVDVWRDGEQLYGADAVRALVALGVADVRRRW